MIYLPTGFTIRRRVRVFRTCPELTAHRLGLILATTGEYRIIDSDVTRVYNRVGKKSSTRDRKSSLSDGASVDVQNRKKRLSAIDALAVSLTLLCVS